MRNLVGHALSRHGYRVFEAGDPEEAERQMSAQHGEIRLVLSDVILPRKDGPQLLAVVARELHGPGPGGRRG